ncbi:unnamed protein product [Callosobruchus maculatus]|nr:unnamed protein product [Callosobruchus maculatus]
MSDSKRPVVFLMHALSTSSRIWVYMGPQSLGYALVDAGYDVWMGNARGTRYGRKHIRMNPNKDPDFWDFSFDEVGYYDLPKMIDYVLRETGTQQLIYIGHSQGNTEFFAMASRRPEYNKKIKVAVAAGPTVFAGGSRNRIQVTFLTIFIRLLGIKEMFRPGPLVPQFGRVFCSGKLLNPCVLIYKSGSGSTASVAPKMMLMLTCAAPEGFSSKMVLHYVQLLKSGEFKRYDYGFVKNKAKYGQHSAPNIDLSKVTAPVAIFYAPNDANIPMKKIGRLHDALPNVQMMYEIKDKHFSHVDFVGSKERGELFNTPLISYLDSVVHSSEDGS